MRDILINDDRKGLIPGSTLIIKEENSDNSFRVKINEELGRGSGCIVYGGSLRKYVEGTGTDSAVIVKELFPKGIGIVRSIKDDAGLMVPEEKTAEFEAYRKSFGKRFITFSEYTRIPGCRSLPDAYVYGTANNTVYAMTCPVKGQQLSKAGAQDFSIDRTASVMEAVCRSIKSLHIKEKLYLDLKPENILYDITENDLQAQAYIIDFDTVRGIREVQQGIGSSPFSAGWSPSEQIPDERDGMYREPALIGYHTDIYSVGLVFFYLLTGRAPKPEDIKAISAGTFAWHEEGEKFRRISSEALEFIAEITVRLLEPDPVVRRRLYRNCFSIREVEKDFARLYGMTTGDCIHYEPIHGRIASLENEVVQLKKEIRELVRAIRTGKI